MYSLTLFRRERDLKLSFVLQKVLQNFFIQNCLTLFTNFMTFSIFYIFYSFSFLSILYSHLNFLCIVMPIYLVIKYIRNQRSEIKTTFNRGRKWFSITRVPVITVNKFLWHKSSYWIFECQEKSSNKFTKDLP